MKKIETSVTLARGGMHSPARYRTFKKQILTNTYKKARLYHLVLKGRTNPKDYSKAAEAIARLLRDNNVPCFGKGCWEVNEERGLHFHFMLIVEAQHGRVDWWLSTKEEGPLKSMLRTLDVQVHIAEPKNKMHLQADGKMPLYAYITKAGPKLDDALVRVSYLYKNDSKIEGLTRTYYSTREKAKKAEPLAPEAPAPTLAVDHLLHTLAVCRVDCVGKCFHAERLEQVFIEARFSAHGVEAGELQARQRDHAGVSQLGNLPETRTQLEPVHLLEDKGHKDDVRGQVLCYLDSLFRRLGSADVIAEDVEQHNE